MRTKTVSILTITAIVVIGLLAFFGRFTKQETLTTKVTGKEVKYSRENSTYMIYTESGVYTLEDELFYGNFRSSDWYGQIHVDSTYQFKVIGYRLGFFSMYPNIVRFNATTDNLTSDTGAYQ